MAQAARGSPAPATSSWWPRALAAGCGASWGAGRECGGCALQRPPPTECGAPLLSCVSGRARARREEGAPPPVVVLRAELEVAHHHGDLGAGDDQDEEDEEQEAKHVVELVQPDGGEDKEELDKHSAKREDSANQYGEGGPHVPDLLGHLPRYLVDADRQVDVLAPVAEVGPRKDQRHGDSEPQHQQRKHGSERDRARRLLAPHKAVEDEEDEKDDAGEEGGREQDVRAPVHLLPYLVQEGGRVAGGHAHKDEEQQHGGAEPAAVGGREEAEHREDHRD